MKDEIASKIKIEQYIRCCEDIRHYDREVWQIFSINITVAGVMMGLSFQYFEGIFRAIPLLFAFLLSLALTITVSKYIVFALGRAGFIRQIEKELEIDSVPTSTEDVLAFLNKEDVREDVRIDAPTEWFKHYMANRWIVGVMVIITITLFLMCLALFFVSLCPL